MIKKYTFTLLIIFGLIFSTCAMISNVYAAEPEPATSSSLRPMDGLYVALRGGISQYTLTGFAETFPPGYYRHNKSDIDVKQTNLIVRLNVGYGYYWNDNIFTGIEFGYGKFIGAKKIELINYETEHKVKITYDEGYSLMLPFGYRFENQGLLYVALGIEKTNVKINPSEFERIDTEGAFHDMEAYVYNLGYSRMLTNNIGALIEIGYLTVNDSYNNSKNDGERYNARLRVKQILLGVFYDF